MDGAVAALGAGQAGDHGELGAGRQGGEQPGLGLGEPLGEVQDDVAEAGDGRASAGGVEEVAGVVPLRRQPFPDQAVEPDEVAGDPAQRLEDAEPRPAEVAQLVVGTRQSPHGGRGARRPARTPPAPSAAPTARRPPAPARSSGAGASSGSPRAARPAAGSWSPRAPPPPGRPLLVPAARARRATIPARLPGISTLTGAIGSSRLASPTTRRRVASACSPYCVDSTRTTDNSACIAGRTAVRVWKSLARCSPALVEPQGWLMNLAHVSEVAGRLSASPMYQLSTAGQELFHTNMLYWLAVNRPYEAAPLWEALGVDVPGTTGPDARGPILREWKHADLVIDSGMPGRKLILENKILAVATPVQLRGYHAEIIKERVYAHDTTSWRLLTLLPPTFELPDPWMPVTYADLLPAVRETATNLGGSERVLLEEYAKLVSTLLDVVRAMDPERHLDSPAFLPSDVRSALAEARALALVRKMQAARCAQLLRQRLVSTLPRDLVQIGAGVGGASKEALVELFLPAPQGRRFGWQLEGRKLRLVGLVGGRDPRSGKGARARRESIMETQHLEFWERFTPPEPLSGLLTPYSGRLTWLGFEPDFVYRYRTLAESTTWAELLDLLTWASEYALAYTGTLR